MRRFNTPVSGLRRGFSRTLLIAFVSAQCAAASDWRNLTSAYGVKPQLNAGVEFLPSKKLKKLFALRAGLSSKGVGTSFGLSIFGIDLALMGKRTLDAATTLHF